MDYVQQAAKNKCDAKPMVTLLEPYYKPVTQSWLNDKETQNSWTAFNSLQKISVGANLW